MKSKFLSTILLSLLPSVSFAGTPFDDAVAEIMSNNLSVRAEAARGHAGVESILADNALESPEVEFARVWGKSENKWSLSVSQSFDWPGIYAARRAAARTADNASQYLLESTVMNLREQVRSALVDLIHNAQLIELQSGLATRMSGIEAKYKRGAEAGAETRIDYNKAVIEMIATNRELHTLEAERAAIIANLQELNGGKDVTGIVASLGSAYPILPSVNQANISPAIVRERDPEYAAAVAAVDAAKSMVKVSRMSRLPGFSVGYEHETEGPESFNGFSVGLSLPVWSRSHQIKASTYEAEAALMDAEMTLVKRSAALSGDLRQLESLRTVLDEYEPVINNSANMDLLQKALDGGQINFITYIQETNYFLEAQKDYLDTLYEYNLTLVRLTRYE